MFIVKSFEPDEGPDIFEVYWLDDLGDINPANDSCCREVKAKIS